jgi:hypothetical protein
MKRDNLLLYSLVALVLLVGGLFLLWSSRNIVAISVAEKSGGSVAALLPEPPPTCHYCSTRLLDASPEQLGEYAVQYATNMHEVSGDPPQVLLARLVAPSDFPTLGLGCPPDFVAIEQPPLALVILKGDLRPNMPGMQPTIFPVKYIAYVFDLWADTPTIEISSRDGGVFRKALNDPTLPESDGGMPSVCPTPVPYKKTLHYGDAAPGFDAPPPLPQDVQEHLQPTTQPPPQPIVSVTVPEPIPTTEDLPIIPPPVSTHEATGTTPQTGNSAIQPTIMGAGPNEPAFTEADVRNFVAQNGGGFGKIGVESGTPQITDIEFLTVAALQQKMAESLNLQRADLAPLCYVEYSGDFSVQGPPINGQTAPKVHYNRVANVFDAHTGNFLMQTAFNSK